MLEVQDPVLLFWLPVEAAELNGSGVFGFLVLGLGFRDEIFPTPVLNTLFTGPRPRCYHHFSLNPQAPKQKNARGSNA